MRALGNKLADELLIKNKEIKALKGIKGWLRYKIIGPKKT
jgi:hypothetical protein